MGGIAGLHVHYTEKIDFFNTISKYQVPVYGAFPNGKNIYEENLTNTGIIILGNEGNGISAELEKRVTVRLSIPPFPQNSKNVESLNVAMAGAIIMSEFRRRI